MFQVPNRFSRKVTIVSFILSIFVMYIHAKNLVYYDFGDVSGTPIHILNQILSETFGRVGVPFFFLMSGYWLFRLDIRQEKAKDILFQKLKKKIYTLGIPYITWNTLGFLYFFIITHIPAISHRVNNGAVVHMDLQTIFQSIFLHKYYFSFWFMQDLIVLMVISPVILLMLRNRWISCLSFMALMILSVLNINIPVCQSSSLLMFFMGGVLAVYHREFWEQDNRHKYSTVFWGLLFLLYCATRWISLPYVSSVLLFLSPIFFWKLLDVLNLFGIYDCEINWFCRQSFFIYASHIYPLDIMNGLLARINQTMLWACISYFLSPLLVLLLIYIAARILYNICPLLYHILSGDRN